MKKQISNSKLTFNKKAISELNDNQLLSINGGVYSNCVSNATLISVQSGVSITINTTNTTLVSMTKTSDVQK